MPYNETDNFSGFVKDPNTNVVLNTNTLEIKAARERKKMMKKEKEIQNSLISDVDNLKSEIKEIKNLLVQLVNNR